MEEKQGLISWLLFGTPKGSAKEGSLGETGLEEQEWTGDVKANVEGDPVLGKRAAEERGGSPLLVPLRKGWDVSKATFSYVQSWISYFIFGAEQGDDEEEEGEVVPQKQGWISYLIFGKRKQTVKRKQGWISWLIFGSSQEEDTSKKRTWWYYFKLMF